MSHSSSGLLGALYRIGPGRQRLRDDRKLRQPWRMRRLVDAIAEFIKANTNELFDGSGYLIVDITTPPGGGGLSTGAIIGISVGGGCAVVLLCILLYFLMRRSKNNIRPSNQAEALQLTQAAKLEAKEAKKQGWVGDGGGKKKKKKKKKKGEEADEMMMGSGGMGMGMFPAGNGGGMYGMQQPMQQHMMPPMMQQPYPYSMPMAGPMAPPGYLMAPPGYVHPGMQ
eukprot:gene2697-12693_t